MSGGRGACLNILRGWLLWWPGWDLSSRTRPYMVGRGGIGLVFLRQTTIAGSCSDEDGESRTRAEPDMDLEATFESVSRILYNIRPNHRVHAKVPLVSRIGAEEGKFSIAKVVRREPVCKTKLRAATTRDNICLQTAWLLP